MTTGQDDKYAAALAYARAEGERAGRAAASWYFDGNTSRATYARVLKGLDEGDPMVLDTLPYADLSGEWADTLTGPQLVDDALSAAGVPVDSPDGEAPSDEREDWFADVCDAYETAFADAARDEIERAARVQLD